MSYLKIYPDQKSAKVDLHTDLPLEIAELLRDYHIAYRKVEINDKLETIIHDDDKQLDLKRGIIPMERQHQFPFASVMVVDENYPHYQRLRLKYLSEHYLNKDEILLFLEGQALLSFHADGKVLQLYCEKGDCVLVPARIRRWIDFGSEPVCLAMMKCMQQEQDQAVIYTGEHISDLYPRLS